MSGKNTFGQALTVTLFGESHGAGVGAVIDGLCAGLPVNKDSIDNKLTLRRPSGKISTARREADEYIIQSGVFDGHTTGTPLCIFIPNKDVKSSSYSRDIARPSHADYTAEIKYHGYQDYRGGGHFSGRVTAPLVALGAIVGDALAKKGIVIATRIKRIATIEDITPTPCNKETLISLSNSPFPVTDTVTGEKMREAIEEAAADGDSVGGVLETVILGLPAGLGEPWFDGVESLISRAVFGIPAVKGIEFGAGFALTDMRGSLANDPMRIFDGKIITETNNSGGIAGGVTNGMPIVFRTAIKPTPSISKTQQTVNIRTLDNVILEQGGRHDPCIVHRARVVLDSVAILVTADMLTVRYGSEALL